MAEKKVQPVLAISPLNTQAAVTKRQTQRVANTIAAAQAISDSNIAILTTENESLKRNLGNTINSINAELIALRSIQNLNINTGIGNVDGGFPSDTYTNIEILDGGIP